MMTSPAAHRILIVTEDVLSSRMAGPAIRSWQLATVLSGSHDVTLATTSSTCEVSSEQFRVQRAEESDLESLEAWCDVLIVQGFVLANSSVLRATDKVLVVDLYDPLHLETLEINRGEPEPARSSNVEASIGVLRDQILRGDFFVCANEKQRDLWLGFMASVGRLNPRTYEEDPTMRRLLDVAPFGLPDRPPVHTRAAVRGVIPGISEGDKVVIWGGGVYDWLDPLTVIRAAHRLRDEIPDVRVLFMGVRHPNTKVEEARILHMARRLSAELGMTGKHVFFNEDWVSYDDRHNYLLEADVGISLHRVHLETAFSSRARILDYLWAGLPIVSTEGDAFAELITSRGLGAVVPPEDEEAVARALATLLTDTRFRTEVQEHVRAVSSDFVWSRTLEPVLRFCSAPSRAPDSDGAEPGSVAPSRKARYRFGRVRSDRAVDIPALGKVAAHLFRNVGARKGAKDRKPG